MLRSLEEPLHQIVSNAGDDDIAGLLITMEAMGVEIPEKKPAPPMPVMGGGMGDMIVIWIVRPASRNPRLGGAFVIPGRTFPGPIPK